VARRKADHRADSFSTFMMDFVTESDRAAVILGASKVEILLGEILDKYLLPVPGSVDELLEGDSPLATLSAKIKICHRLGLIDDQLAKLLHIFRRLRNAFAHEVSAHALQDGPSRDRVAAMAEPFIRAPFFQYLVAAVATSMGRAESDSGVIFRTVLSFFYMHCPGSLSEYVRC